MSPQLREGLRVTAEAAGCSVNAFAVQILATAVGDPALFRVPPAPDVCATDLERDARGYPLDQRERSIHIVARSEFIADMGADKNISTEEWVAEVKRHDAEDPEFFVAWLDNRRARQAEARLRPREQAQRPDWPTGGAT